MGVKQHTTYAAAYVIIAVTTIVLSLPSVASAAAGCTVSDNNWGPNNHQLDDGEQVIHVHLQNDGDTNSIGSSYRGDAKIQYTGDNSQGLASAYYKPNQPNNGDFEILYQVNSSGGNSKDYDLRITPSGNFSNYAPKIYVGNAYSNPVGNAPLTECTVNLHLSHGSVVSPPAAPILTGSAGNAQTTLSWNSVTGASIYKIYRNGSLASTSTDTSWTDTGLTNGTAYSYTVRTSSTANGDSNDSNSVSLTPSAPTSGGGTTGGTTVTDITPRDTHLIALGLATLIGYKFIGLFRYKGNE